MSTTAHAGTHPHPSLPAYVRIATILAIITAVEVAVYYIPALRGILVPALIVMSLVKFILVVSYFMHLKFDDPFLRNLFTAAMVVSIIMFIGVWVVMHYDVVTVFNSNMSIFPEKRGIGN